jgi:hypothetical protein
MKKCITATTGALAVIYALMGCPRLAVAQDSVIGIEVPPTSQSDAIAPDVTPPPFTKFSAYASGSFTTASPLTACTAASVTCQSGVCNGCFTFSNLPLKGLTGTTISGEMIIENDAELGDCYVSHGAAVATGKSFTINFGIAGQLCYQPTLSLDDLQFTGNYIVRGGSGAYGSAAGTGTFATDFASSFSTVTRSLTMTGVIQKAN